MARRGLVWSIAALAVLGPVAGCAPLEGAAADAAAPPDGLRLEFEDALAPAVFAWTGRAAADASDGAPGLWAAVPGLRQPERARVQHAGTGATVDVALYAGRAGAAVLSAQAAAALEIGPDGAPVRVTALRREARLAGR